MVLLLQSKQPVGLWLLLLQRTQPPAQQKHSHRPLGKQMPRRRRLCWLMRQRRQQSLHLLLLHSWSR
jgi:hypothetical protein